MPQNFSSIFWKPNFGFFFRSGVFIVILLNRILPNLNTKSTLFLAIAFRLYTENVLNINFLANSITVSSVSTFVLAPIKVANRCGMGKPIKRKFRDTSSIV